MSRWSWEGGGNQKNGSSKCAKSFGQHCCHNTLIFLLHLELFLVDCFLKVKLEYAAVHLENSKPISYLHCLRKQGFYLNDGFANLNAWAAFANYRVSTDHWKRPLFYNRFIYLQEIKPEIKNESPRTAQSSILHC